MLCFNVITLKKGNNANDNTDEIYTVYGSDATIITTIRNWFKRFRIDNFDLKNEGCNNRLQQDCLATTNTLKPYSLKICNIMCKR